MSDDDSAGREAQRRAFLDRLKTRPRGDKDAPLLTAYFTPKDESPNTESPNTESKDEALGQARALMQALIGTTRYFQQWRVVRTQAEHSANTGLDPLAAPDEWDAHVFALNDGDAALRFDVLAFSDQIAQDDPRLYAAGLGYEGASAPRKPLRLRIYCAQTDPDHNMTLHEWARVIETLVAWRPPAYISVGPSSYGIHDRVFDHRAWDGWMGWLPADIAHARLPDHAQTFRIGHGTLVATQDSNVIARLNDHRARAQAVEVALVEMGVLPTLAALTGG